MQGKQGNSRLQGIAVPLNAPEDMFYLGTQFSSVLQLSFHAVLRAFCTVASRASGTANRAVGAATIL